MDYLEIKGKQKKINIDNFQLNFGQSGSSFGGGVAVGIGKVTSCEFYLKGGNIHLFQVFTNYPSHQILPQISIFKNSKKAFEFYECRVLSFMEVEGGLARANLEFRRLTILS